MTQTNKPLVFPRLTPVLLPIVLLASVFMITACGGKKSTPVANTFTPPPPPPPPPTFTSRVINNVPADIQSQVADIVSRPEGQLKNSILEDLGEDYLESISFNLPRDGEVETYALQEDSSDGNLTARDGFLMTFVTNTESTYAHVVTGIFASTDVGRTLTADATLTGKYSVRLVAVPEAVGNAPPVPLGETVIDEDITLNVNFIERTVRGDASYQGATLRVNGEFANKVLFGNVSFSESTRSMSFEAPLTGLIGQDGAVGVFSSHKRTGRKHSLGGGFVVEPEPANNN